MNEADYIELVVGDRILSVSHAGTRYVLRIVDGGETIAGMVIPEDVARDFVFAIKAHNEGRRAAYKALSRVFADTPPSPKRPTIRGVNGEYRFVLRDDEE